MGFLTIINLLFEVGTIFAAQEWTVVTNVPTIPQHLGPGLLRLHVVDNKLLYLNFSSLQNYPKLKKLNLDKCGLEYIAEGTFDATPHLTDLYVLSLPLKALPSTLGSAQLSLNWIKLWGLLGAPVYELLSENYFRSFPQLTHLWLGGNVIEHLNTIILPSQLEYLNVRSSRMTSFPNLSNIVPLLTHVRCAWNQIRFIPLENLVGLGRVKTFHIHHNQLEKLPDLGFMLQLYDLGIDNNNLESLLDLYHLPLEILHLTGNPWVCDKALCWIRMWPWGKLLPVLGNPQCAKPPELQGSQLMSVSPTLMHCYDGKLK